MTFLVSGLLRRVPLWVYVAAILLLAGWYYGHTRFNAGQADIQAKWDAQKAKDADELAKLKQKAAEVTVRVETKYIDRVKTVREKGETIVKVREVFVPVDSGLLSGGFRLYYDSAIEGSVPDATRIPDAAPVPVTDVADTHAYNAKQCRIAYATVEAWQQWATEQKRLNP